MCKMTGWVLGLVVMLVAMGCAGPELASHGGEASVPVPEVTQVAPTDAPTEAVATPVEEPDAPATEPAPEPTAPPLEPVLPPGVIAGMVRNAEGPVEGATVRVRLTENKATTDAKGSFTLSEVAGTAPVSVTAWADGYYVGWTNGIAGLVPVTITLKPYPATDNLDYDWFTWQGLVGSDSCSSCHPAYTEWKADAHSQSAVNPSGRPTLTPSPLSTPAS